MQLKVPTRFWEDHAERKPCDGDPESEMARVVKVGQRYTMIEGTPAQIETLRSDAEFYCDPDGPCEDLPGLKASAAATLRAIAKAQGEEARNR